MAEWLYAQKLEEINTQHEDFKRDTAYEIMQRLIDVRDENDINSYLAMNDLRLELTAKAHGRELSAKEIKEDEFLLAGVELYSGKIIDPRLMAKYRAKPNSLESMATLIMGAGAGLSAKDYIMRESSEELVNYIKNSVEYFDEAEADEKEEISNLVYELVSNMINENRHLDYLSNEENFEYFSTAVTAAKDTGIIRADEVTLENILNGDIDPRLPLELIDEL